ncbi:hypothetical protein Aasi_0874 [Candidatus Amoebophilus asiaticus 5a2]|uniref:Lipoprotein n=1 Tax=Amoebophilus asiaticus (strain 5a2) TaxID=452471 RepID=B3ESP1_AMOA5|nr:hypothetical protein [Candidatus Amoebophilus asiaticus]ACE06243.1 hypothetical protein Aasi_0874 [Candidatus Amoebophilus asiaticus 5a2]
MKETYKLSHKFMASILVVCLFLQSCGFTNSPLHIPLRKDNGIEANYQSILNKKFTAEGNCQVTFYEYKGELQASIEPYNEKYKVYNCIPVKVEEGLNLIS